MDSPPQKRIKKDETSYTPILQSFQQRTRQNNRVIPIGYNKSAFSNDSLRMSVKNVQPCLKNTIVELTLNMA